MSSSTSHFKRFLENFDKNAHIFDKNIALYKSDDFKAFQSSKTCARITCPNFVRAIYAFAKVLHPEVGKQQLCDCIKTSDDRRLVCDLTKPDALNGLMRLMYAPDAFTAHNFKLHQPRSRLSINYTRCEVYFLWMWVHFRSEWGLCPRPCFCGSMDNHWDAIYHPALFQWGNDDLTVFNGTPSKYLRRLVDGQLWLERTATSIFIRGFSEQDEFAVINIPIEEEQTFLKHCALFKLYSLAFYHLFHDKERCSCPSSCECRSIGTTAQMPIQGSNTKAIYNDAASSCSCQKQFFDLWHHRTDRGACGGTCVCQVPEEVATAASPWSVVRSQVLSPEEVAEGWWWCSANHTAYWLIKQTRKLFRGSRMRQMTNTFSTFNNDFRAVLEKNITTHEQKVELAIIDAIALSSYNELVCEPIQKWMVAVSGRPANKKMFKDFCWKQYKSEAWWVEYNKAFTSITLLFVGAVLDCLGSYDNDWGIRDIEALWKGVKDERMGLYLSRLPHLLRGIITKPHRHSRPKCSPLFLKSLGESRVYFHRTQKKTKEMKK